MPFQFRKDAIENLLNEQFPSQGQGNPPLYYSLSEVVVPTFSINEVASGSALPEMLQTAWDFSTGANQITATSFTNIITNPGFWLIDLTYAGLDLQDTSSRLTAQVDIYDGTTSKPVWGVSNSIDGIAKDFSYVVEAKFVVYLRGGDVCRAKCQSTDNTLDVWYRQIATPNGTLVNPLGFSF